MSSKHNVELSLRAVAETLKNGRKKAIQNEVNNADIIEDVKKERRSKVRAELVESTLEAVKAAKKELMSLKVQHRNAAADEKKFYVPKNGQETDYLLRKIITQRHLEYIPTNKFLAEFQSISDPIERQIFTEEAHWILNNREMKSPEEISARHSALNGIEEEQNNLVSDQTREMDEYVQGNEPLLNFLNSFETELMVGKLEPKQIHIFAGLSGNNDLKEIAQDFAENKVVAKDSVVVV